MKYRTAFNYLLGLHNVVELNQQMLVLLGIAIKSVCIEKTTCQAKKKLVLFSGAKITFTAISNCLFYFEVDIFYNTCFVFNVVIL